VGSVILQPSGQLAEICLRSLLTFATSIAPTAVAGIIVNTAICRNLAKDQNNPGSVP